MSGQSPIFQYEMMAGGFEKVTAEDVASDVQGLKFFGKTENEQLNDEANDDSIYAIADKHSPASSARSTKWRVRGMLLSVGVESSY